MSCKSSILAGILVLGTSSIAMAQSMPSAPPAMSGAMNSMSSMSKVTVKLDAQNKSGETATAVLAQVGPDVLVTVTTMGGPADPQPIHIHQGTCAALNPKPLYPLTTVQDAKSVTTLKGMTLASLETGDFAINIHHSTSDIPTYYACGDIPKMAKM